MLELNAVLGMSGTHATLHALERSSATWQPYQAVVDLLASNGCLDPPRTVDHLLGLNLLQRNAEGLAITQFGVRTSLLLDAINGADLRDTWRRLIQLDPGLRNYELLRNQLTSEFLDSLIARPGFGRLYICSPWISLDQRQQNILAHAVVLGGRARCQIEIMVVTRPREGTQDKLAASAEFLRQLGAEVYLNQRLHTKLYIREPGVNGGLYMAILGSQNLTRSTYLELGIRIHSDTVILQNLVRYFLDLVAQSDEAR